MAVAERVVIITGGSGGLGQALAKQHLDMGDIVVITGRDPAKLENSKRELGSQEQLHTYELYVDNNEQVRRFSAWIKVHFGRCDFLYNNAGSAVFKPFLEMSLQEIHDSLAANLQGVLYVTRAFLPMMLEEKRGHVVMIASLAGRVATAKAAVYAASKAAVIRFSEGLQSEINQSGVHVTCVQPGPLDTPFLELADTTGMYRSKVSRFLVHPERAARRIIKGVTANKAEICLPRRLYFLSIIHQLLPASIKRLFLPIINRK